MPKIIVENLHKTYRLGRVGVPVLRGVSLTIEPGEFVAILGASGSGKSTLLHVLGGLDQPDRPAPGAPACRISVGDQDILALGAAGRDTFRSRTVGFVFQFYHLFPELTVTENVLIGAMVRHGRLGYLRNAGDLRARAAGLIEAVGLSHRAAHRPAELSGGERQRTALARALINDPPVLLADEPTGNLDRQTGGRILDMLCALAGGRKRTMLVVTHDPDTAARADRVVRLQDGLVVDQGAPKPEPVGV